MLKNDKTDGKTNLLKFNIIDEKLYFNEIDITSSVVRYDLHGGDMHPKDVSHLKIELIVQI